MFSGAGEAGEQEWKGHSQGHTRRSLQKEWGASWARLRLWNPGPNHRQSLDVTDREPRSCCSPSPSTRAAGGPGGHSSHPGHVVGRACESRPTGPRERIFPPHSFPNSGTQPPSRSSPFACSLGPEPTRVHVSTDLSNKCCECIFCFLS